MAKKKKDRILEHPIPSYFGYKKRMARLNTPEGKKEMYIGVIMFIFLGLFFFSLFLGNQIDWEAVHSSEIPAHSELPEEYYPFLPFAQYLGYASFVGFLSTMIFGFIYHKRVWGEPLYFSWIVPHKYWGITAKLAYTIFGIILILAALWSVFNIADMNAKIAFSVVYIILGIAFIKYAQS